MTSTESPVTSLETATFDWISESFTTNWFTGSTAYGDVSTEERTSSWSDSSTTASDISSTDVSSSTQDDVSFSTFTNDVNGTSDVSTSLSTDDGTTIEDMADATTLFLTTDDASNSDSHESGSSGESCSRTRRHIQANLHCALVYIAMCSRVLNENMIVKARDFTHAFGPIFK